MSTAVMNECPGVLRAGRQVTPRKRIVPVAALSTLNVLALLAVAYAWRICELDRLPGINGDEAWYGVSALRWIHGAGISCHTPSGNLLNPFYFLPLALLHLCYEPSGTLLRTPAVVSGLLACGVNYWLCRRVFDRRSAIVSTVLLAILPINLAYSRFGWDASQSLLAVLCVLYASLWPDPTWRTRGVAVLALGAAVWVHPTNVFAAALVVVPWYYHWVEIKALAVGTKTVRDLGLLAFACCLLGSGTKLVAFAINYLRLFSGATVYRYISGGLPNSGELPTLSDFDGFDAVTLVIVVAAVYGFVRQMREEQSLADRWLGWGLLAMLTGFFLVAGPAAAQPHFERYALVLIGPSALLFARGTIWWLRVPAWRGGAALCVALCGWMLLASFYWGYFGCFAATGGQSHVAFRTAGVEPKVQVLAIVRRDVVDREPNWLVADDWWLYWPLRYLAEGDDTIHVAHWADLPEGVLSGRLPGIHLLSVQFVSDKSDVAAVEWFRGAGRGVQRSVVFDQNGQPLISLLKATGVKANAKDES
jgi:hypothetical protein